MTEPRAVPLDIHHHHDPTGVTTCIGMRSALISVDIGGDIDPEAKADLCAVLGQLLPLMGEIWASDQDGPMVYDLRRGGA